MTAYQITSMMEGVVQRGTATRGARGRQAGRRQDRHHQRREGRLVRRLLARPRGRRLSRLRQAAPARPRRDRRPLAAPIVKEFLKVALADKPAVPFRVPAGIKLIRIDAKSGMRAGAGGEGGRVILEAFKPGTAPPDSYSVIGYTDAERPAGRRPAAVIRLAGVRSRRMPIARCAAAPAELLTDRDAHSMLWQLHLLPRDRAHAHPAVRPDRAWARVDRLHAVAVERARCASAGCRSSSRSTRCRRGASPRIAVDRVACRHRRACSGTGRRLPRASAAVPTALPRSLRALIDDHAAVRRRS